MLTIRHAAAIMIDESTETSGDLHLDRGIVVAPDARRYPADQSPQSDNPVAETLDATGCVVTPGLVNAHHHLLQTAFRTLPGTRGVAMAQWLPTMAAAYARAGIDAELEHAAALAGLAESLLSGVTTVADHHLNWPGGPGKTDNPLTVDIARAAASAADELGARLVFVRGSARDDPEQAALSAESIVAALLGETATDRIVGTVGTEAAHSTGGVTRNGMLQVAVGPAGVHSDSLETFRLFAEVAARHGLRRRTQANEQVDVAIALEKFGRRPVDLLDEWGWLAPDVTLAHLCDVTADEIARLAAAGITATHAPACDLPMGWGIAPVAALRASGVSVGIGTSGGGSNDASHLLADARLAMQIAPLAGPPIPAREVLGMATKGSALGLGRPELGSLTLGDAADLCVWDVSGVADAAVADPIAGLLWANPGRRPKHVVVAGRVVVRDYRLVGHDERDIAADLESLLARRHATA